MTEETMEFPDGLFVKAPHEKAPDFVKAKISIKRKDFGNWLRHQTGDFINLDVKVSKNGKWYVVVDTWSPDSEKKSPQQATPTNDDFEDDSEIPF